MDDSDRDLEEARVVQPRIFRDRTDPLDSLNDEQCRRRYRFTRNGFFVVFGVLEDDPTTTARSHALLPAQRLALALQALASNSFQLIIGDIAGVSQPTVSRVIRQVCEVVSNKVDFFVNWPQGEELIDNYKKFKELTNIPKVVGAVDGTHVRIPATKDGEHLFVNRKSYHSMNVELACDFNLKFISLSCRFGGSAHDSRVFRESGAHANLQAGNYEGVLLGDSGYRCESFLYKPILNPNSNAESRFTDALCRGRVKIENAIGCLKRQFHCLNSELRPDDKIGFFGTRCTSRPVNEYELEGTQNGDSIFSRFYEIVMYVRHNCTRNGKREIERVHEYVLIRQPKDEYNKQTCWTQQAEKEEPAPKPKPVLTLRANNTGKVSRKARVDYNEQLDNVGVKPLGKPPGQKHQDPDYKH